MRKFLLGAALGVVRFLPGPGGMVADLAWRVLAPGQHQQADAERDSHADGFQTLLGVIDTLPNTATMADLKTKVGTKPAPTIRDALLTTAR